ncbi:YeaC family protein [Dickeya undicola]|uniref:DUF1315 family protein n=1 Tax=Dickeya undicola TaxID=1577887 RepID=A0A3N0G6Q8_9GAMM|nr:DUF1315 family protein [Dickeya undicola]RNM07916.1 DUF1315 family protein [Dickeya undicola]RNM24330.1 DUF1315 family protein [Dickeya undicola]
MQLDDLINSMTPEIYQRLVTAVELGKWPDGVTLTAEQKENALQMVMLWQARNNAEADHMTINTRGEIEMKSKQELKQRFAGDTVAASAPAATLKPITTLKPQD